MLRVLALIALAAAMFAQNPPATGQKKAGDAVPKGAEAAPSAPPEVDAALRARIAQFYQFEVEGKHSQALQLVADDTKDLFAGSSKPIYRGFAIQSIQYSDDFTKARVLMVIQKMLPVEGFVGHPLAGKVVSRWKLENGLWFWYIDRKQIPTSPFATANLPPGLPATMPTAAPPGAPSAIPMAPGVAQPVPRANPPVIPNAVTVDKSNVQLKTTGPSSDKVVLFNPTPWAAAFTVNDPKVPGLTVKLDKPYATMGHKVVASFEWSGAGDPPRGPVTVNITVARTKQTVPIRVSFAK